MAFPFDFRPRNFAVGKRRRIRYDRAMHGGKQELLRAFVAKVMAGHTLEEVEARLRPSAVPPPPALTPSVECTPERVERFWEHLPVECRADLLDDHTVRNLESYRHNIENCIGTIKLPVGLAGPLRINGLNAHGDFLVPLATSEAALVASYHRGACLVSAAGGCSAIVLYESVSRAPAFVFHDLVEAGKFLIWLTGNIDRLGATAEATTRHGRLIDFFPTVESNHVYLTLEFSTGDASGQNMVTLAAQAVVDQIMAECPVRPRRAYVEGNLSGDKKASAKAYTTTRGKKVAAEVRLPSALVERYLHATPTQMADYWRLSAVGGVLSGTMGVQGHFANGLAAIYLATGQDAACVAESAVGVTRFEVTEDGGLYASVTLPGIMVGTVGGGTRLPSQRACLRLLGLEGEGKSRALAEVCAALLLAGELSIIGAMAAGHFARAHRKLARDRRIPDAENGPEGD